MVKNDQFIIILLIFASITYIILIGLSSFFLATSYIIGFIAASIDILLLRRLVNLLKKERPSNMLILSTFRWGVFGIIVSASFYFLKSDPIYLIIGIILPFAIHTIYYIINYITELRNGTSS